MCGNKRDSIVSVPEGPDITSSRNNFDSINPHASLQTSGSLRRYGLGISTIISNDPLKQTGLDQFLAGLQDDSLTA